MITILCSGSRGDFQPYIALALQLKTLGKAVKIAGGRSFEEFIRSYGIDYYPLSADYQSIDIDPQLLREAQSADNPIKMLLTFNKMKNYVLHITGEMYDACEGSELVVYHPGCTIGYFAAENMGIPSVLAAPFPMHKTNEVASVIAYGHQNMPKSMSYSLLQGMLWMASKTSAAAFLKEKFDKLPANFGCPFERVDKHHPSIISCSNFVFKRPGDWNENIHQSGYWFVDEQIEYTPSDELDKFLLCGEKPIYFGFGSIFSEDDKEKFVEIITEALKISGRRGIISGMGTIDNLPPTVFAVGSIPHSWLFERVSAVCHHGGAGTTAAGFRAGVPGIIVPFSNDQFAWARRSYDLGVGAKPLNRKKMTANDLAEAITFVFSESVKTNARELAKNIAAENGAKDCAQVIVNLLER